MDVQKLHFIVWEKDKSIPCERPPRKWSRVCCVSDNCVFGHAPVSVGLPEGITPTGCLLVLTVGCSFYWNK